MHPRKQKAGRAQDPPLRKGNDVNRRFQTQRNSIRLENFDYSSNAAYFVTICTQARDINWLGELSRDGMRLNAAGQMVLEVWNDLPKRFSIELDAFVIMPDHVHGIIVVRNLVGAGLVPALDTPKPTAQAVQPTHDASATRATTRVAPTVLGDVVGAFKSITTHRYIQGVRELGWSPFEKRFWQRDYWERVIRDDRELEETRSYILENPARRFETRGVA
jgi:putative transposase